VIARMDRITVVGRRSAAREVLQSLQSLGVVQVDPLEPDEGVELVRHRLEGQDRNEAERWATAVSRIDGLQRALSVSASKAASRSEVPTDLAEIEAYLNDLGTQVDAALAERTAASEESSTIGGGATALPATRPHARRSTTGTLAHRRPVLRAQRPDCRIAD
jgi:hypothetical protein